MGKWTHRGDWSLDAGQPPDIIPFIGHRVSDVWQSKTMLVLLFDRDRVLVFEAKPKIDGKFVVEVTAAHLKDMQKATAMLNVEGLQNAYTKAVRGSKFGGMDGNIILFGSKGAKLMEEGIQWVRMVN